MSDNTKTSQFQMPKEPNLNVMLVHLIASNSSSIIVARPPEHGIAGVTLLIVEDIGVWDEVGEICLSLQTASRHSRYQIKTDEPLSKFIDWIAGQEAQVAWAPLEGAGVSLLGERHNLHVFGFCGKEPCNKIIALMNNQGMDLPLYQ